MHESGVALELLIRRVSRVALLGMPSFWKSLGRILCSEI
jgi:hypothetical protein